MLIRNTARLSVGELGSRIPLIILEVALARILGPAGYGVWSVIQTVVTYGNFLHLGVASSLARREPGLIERGALEEVLANRAATYGFQILVVAAVSGLILVVSAVNDGAFDRIGGTLTAMTILTVVLAQQITITAQSSALNEYKVLETSGAKLLYATLFLIVGVVVARYDPPMVWLTLAWAGTLLVALVALNGMANGLLVLPAIELQRTFSLLKDGFPIMMQGLLRFGLMSIDKIAVFFLARPEAVGFYGLGALAASVTGLFGTMIARVSLPTLLRVRERSDSKVLMLREFDRMLMLIQVLLFSAMFVICAFAPIVVNYILPDYESAMHVIGLLAIAGGMAGFAQAMSDVTMSLGLKKPVLINTSAALFILAIFMMLGWNLGAGIEGIAAAVLVVMVIMSGRGFWLAMLVLGLERLEAFRRMRSAFLVVVLIIPLCLGVQELQIVSLHLLDRDPKLFVGLNIILLLLFAVGSWHLINEIRKRVIAD